MADPAQCNPEAQCCLTDGADHQGGDVNPHHLHDAPADVDSIDEQTTTTSTSGDGEEVHGNCVSPDDPPPPLESSGNSASVAGVASRLNLSSHAASSSGRAWSISSRLTLSDNGDDSTVGDHGTDIVMPFLDSDRENLPSRFLNPAYERTTGESQNRVAILLADDVAVPGIIPPPYLYPAEIALEDLL